MSIRYLEDYEEQCKRCKGECGVEGMSGCIVCHGFVPMTNADRIRSMTDEELASFLDEVNSVFCACVMDKSPCESDNCPCWLIWLKEEFKNE